MIPEKRVSFHTVLAFVTLSSSTTVVCSPQHSQIEPAHSQIEPAVTSQILREDEAALRVVPIPITKWGAYKYIDESEINFLEKLGKDYMRRSFVHQVRYFCNDLAELRGVGINREFNWPTSGPIYGFFGGGHEGLDISSPYGRPVYTAEKGVVVGRFELPYGYGNHLMVYHGGGGMTLYAHLSSMEVSVGEIVNREGEIGKVGSTGNSSSPHLHFEILQNCKQVNPLEYLPR